MQTPKTPAKTAARKTAAPARAVPARKAAAAPRTAAVQRVAKPRRNGVAAPAAVAATAVAVAPAAADLLGKDKKVKLVRDSISIPKTEYEVLGELKLRAGKLAVSVKKTELLRAGIKALAAMPDAAFLAALRVVPNLKTGRPAKAT